MYCNLFNFVKIIIKELETFQKVDYNNKEIFHTEF